MNRENIEEIAARLEEVVGNAFHDAMVSVLETNYYDEEWDVSDEEIYEIKDELVKLLKQR
jgi:hypothetical protein